MKFNIIYVVINQGEVMYATTSQQDAEGYADEQNYKAREAVLKDFGNDDPSYEDIAEADFTAGFYGDYHEVVTVNIANKTEDDMVILPDGDEIEVSELIKNLKRN